MGALEEALAKIRGPDETVISVEIEFTDKGTEVNTRKFLTVNTSTYTDAYIRSGYPRYHHEAILLDRPCRVYADIEFYPDPGAWDTCEPRLAGITEEISSRLVRILRLPEPPAALYATGHRPPGKFSVHLTFPDIWMRTPESVLALVHDIPGIDQQVYSRTCTKFMRLPYSEKIAHPGFPILPGGVPLPPGKRWPAVDRATFLRATITLGPRSACTPLYELPHMVLTRTVRSAVSPAQEAYARRVLEYLSATRGPFQLAGTIQSAGNGWEVVISPGLYCARKGSPHISHRTYIGSRGRRVYYWCPDIQCRRKVYFREAFT